ncbi:restriction endonuclease subunit S [Acinetobacter haemolyticus]|uniref:restriction endonuclease subunit S n=1 Tax=Acinetobacter haemolyticus TaxID=29430 RepID=UPI002A69D67C|nr:restriction endonuclease subunit S [Acinetobacter haemolyticus]WPO67544.1 restriction endonuclease subunit S [Acinetobacter haemolyticus]
MRNDKWLKTTVGQYSPFVYGKAIKKADQKTDGIPVYGSNGIYTYSDSTIINQHAVIIGRKGSVGKVHLSTEPCWVSDTAFYVLKDSLEESYFVYYLLSSLGLEYMNTDAAVPGLNRDNAHRLEISIPNTVEKRIALVEPLIKLDQKIHLNNKINQTLESIAQAIFKSWFIDFEPVRAKISAKQTGQDPELAAMYAISGKSEAELEQMAKEDFAELQATAALFPDELVESELGEVPRGWSIAKVDDILNRIKIKKRFKKNDVNEFGRTFVLEQGSNIILGFHNDEGSIPASKEEPAFIFGDHTCITKLMLSNFDVSENVIAVTGKERNSYWTYYAIRDLQKFQEYRRHWMELVSKQVVMADIILTDYFAKKVKTLHEEIENFVHENLVLINLRDTLLPKLLSGEVDVSSLDLELTHE